MARYVMDAFTLSHLVDSDLCIDPSHQLVGDCASNGVSGPIR
jgi:hypothetical protein